MYPTRTDVRIANDFSQDRYSNVRNKQTRVSLEEWRKYNHPEYGKWCWISNTGDHFIVEVENCGGFLELAKCKSLISAKRWVAINLIKR